MEIRQLRYFLQLCEDLNFSLAASNLYITQQALSKTIRNMEEELGVQLFVRSSTGLQLTEYGLSYAQTAQSILQQLDSSGAELKRMGQEKKRIFRVGCTFGLIGGMQRLQKDFEQRFPRLGVSVVEQTDQQCEQMLLNRKLDLAFVTMPANSEHFEARPFFSTDLCLLISRRNPLSQRKDLQPEDFRDEYFLDGGESFNAGAATRKILRQNGLDPQFRAVSLNILALNMLCLENKGLHILTRIDGETIAAHFEGLACIPFPVPEFKWQLAAITRKNEAVSRDLQSCLDYFTEALPPLIQLGMYLNVETMREP